MDLSKIISISGQSGLFRVVAQSKNGLIVESLTDKKRFPALASQRVSVLDSISIFLLNGETEPLYEVLKKIYEKENGKPAPDAKQSSDEQVKKYFEEILPGYDKEQVHLSDMRKTILWYNILQKADVFTQKEENKKDVPAVMADEAGKKPDAFHPRHHDVHGRQLHSAGAPKKTFGVRKTGEA